MRGGYCANCRTFSKKLYLTVETPVDGELYRYVCYPCFTGIDPLLPEADGYLPEPTPREDVPA
jgi:hypothetical protein